MRLEVMMLLCSWLTLFRYQLSLLIRNLSIQLGSDESLKCTRVYKYPNYESALAAIGKGQTERKGDTYDANFVSTLGMNL